MCQARPEMRICSSCSGRLESPAMAANTFPLCPKCQWSDWWGPHRKQLVTVVQCAATNLAWHCGRQAQLNFKRSQMTAPRLRASSSAQVFPLKPVCFFLAEQLVACLYCWFRLWLWGGCVLATPGSTWLADTRRIELERWQAELVESCDTECSYCLAM